MGQLLCSLKDMAQNSLIRSQEGDIQNVTTLIKSCPYSDMLLKPQKHLLYCEAKEVKLDLFHEDFKFRANVIKGFFSLEGNDFYMDRPDYHIVGFGPGEVKCLPY